MKVAETRKLITQSIIDALKEGKKPWAKGWTDCPNTLGLAKSLSTGKPYRGINQWVLQAIAFKRGIQSNGFATFNQVKHLDGFIKKGSKAIKIIFWKPIKRERVNDSGKLVDDSFAVLKTFNVFSVEDTSLKNFKAGFGQSVEPSFDRFEQFDNLIEKLGVDVRRGKNKAFYSPNDDVINMPFESQFSCHDEWYSTFAHELMHWTEKRIGFDRSKIEDAYAFAELVAEMGACMLLNELQIPYANITNSSNYIGSWLEKMNCDTRFLFKASSWATKFVDFITSTVNSEKEVLISSESLPFKGV
jgi:antirestriction protein ArdC